ncbi:bifunctional DNA-formamidopyrimidine glycosylase/DNA-(apurinic or apyrimidinic site) lyase [bacterium]|nr:bifunctional DNA-formamidopyrimidine glycosylase/DNA-(apurinic or apyrimidinic site) lyase [bacterium]
MPELPEVETVARSLRPFLLGQTITRIEIFKDKSFPDVAQQKHVLGVKIVAIKRRAKLIIIDFANNYHLVTHLKMTGQLLYRHQGHNQAGGGHPTADIFADLPSKHTRVAYTLSNQDHLFFNDLRIFGWQKIFTTSQLQSELAKYGPDANALNSHDIHALEISWARCRRPIKQVLMDNKYLSGLGNIYAAEVCYRTRLDPRTPTMKVTPGQIEALAQQAHDLLTEAIKYGGTTFDGRYVDANGQGGNFESHLDVYGRANQPCHRCGHLLETLKIGGRSTVFCPECQR